MIKTATRRFANRKAERNFDWVTFNKDGMDTARRRLDVALVEEAMKAMYEPEPEQDYYMVSKIVWDDYSDDEDDYLSWDWEVEGVYDNYKDAGKAAKLCGGEINVINRAEYEYEQEYLMNRKYFWG